MTGVALRIQNLPPQSQVLSLLRLAQVRHGVTHATAADVDEMYGELLIPAPPKIGNILVRLEQKGLVVRGPGRGLWAITPRGRSALAEEQLDERILPALEAEMATEGYSSLGETDHPLVPPELAPPDLQVGIANMLQRSPFETNVFCMTRFPTPGDELAAAIGAARDALFEHGLNLYTADQRSFVDDLWPNVLVHLWASKYGLAFVESADGKPLNINMSIEIGAMLATGRRCALLRDETVEKMPTDLVGKLTLPVDITDPSTVAVAAHRWSAQDLGLGACRDCAT